MFLSKFDFNIKYRPAKQQGLFDVLSRQFNFLSKVEEEAYDLQ